MKQQTLLKLACAEHPQEQDAHAAHDARHRDRRGRGDRDGRRRPGAQSQIEEQISSLGTNLIMITPGATQQGGVSQGAGTFNRLTSTTRRS